VAVANLPIFASPGEGGREPANATPVDVIDRLKPVLLSECKERVEQDQDRLAAPSKRDIRAPGQAQKH